MGTSGPLSSVLGSTSAWVRDCEFYEVSRRFATPRLDALVLTLPMILWLRQAIPVVDDPFGWE
jgi:hypothetical protein